MLKLLFWDVGGLCIIAKRLEKGTFETPVSSELNLEIKPIDLQLILEGINLHAISYRSRYKGTE